MEDLTTLGTPKEFWKYFYQITQIPRCSGKEDLIREYIKKKAIKFNYEPIIDEAGNLLVKGSSINKKGITKIIIQSHMDMVCEKNENIMHDFSKDPLNLKLIDIKDEKWLTAEGTTLGADNGVGIAYSLALMKRIHKNSLKFENLLIEFLFTVDEEVGLKGAFNINKDFIDGKYLINLDSEEENKFIIGCAGGINTVGKVEVKYDSLKKKADLFIPLNMSIMGLKGGHSGTDIHRGRANSIKIISKILWKINKKFDLQLHSINGGNRANAIPREAKAIIYIDKHQKNEILEFIERIINEIEMGIARIEPEMSITAELLDNFEKDNIYPKIIKDKLLHLLYIIPNGPISMHPKIKDLVYTSSNLASIRSSEESIQIITSQRSLHEISKTIMYEKIEALFKLADMDIVISHPGNYPGWTPNFDSELLNKAKMVYKDLFNEEPVVQVIHAGLECGILKKHFPKIEMISMGPKIEGGHSPDERLHIKSVKKIWNLLIQLLMILN